MSAVTIEEAQAAAAAANRAAEAARKALDQAVREQREAQEKARAEAEAAKALRMKGSGAATVNAGELLAALKVCIGVTPAKEPNVLIEAGEHGRLRFRGRNAEMSVELSIAAEAVSPFSAVVNGRLWATLLSRTPKTVRVEVTRADASVRMAVGGGIEVETKWGDPVDFPGAPSFTPGARAVFCGSEFRKALPRLFVAAATDDSRPVLTGVCYRPGDHQWAAADGFRLTMLKMEPLEGSLGDARVIFPPALLMAAKRVHDDDAVALEMNEKRTLFRIAVDGATYTGMPIIGSYPEYEKLVPEEWTTRVTFDGAGFREAIQTVAVIAKDGSGIVRVQTTPGGVQLAAAGDGSEVRLEVPAAVEGEPNKIAFNSHYLKQLAMHFDGDFSLAWNRPSEQGVARAVGSSALTHVLMPMFVQW